MGYRKIPNLYKDQTILEFRQCFALEKVHGTSAHIKWNGATNELRFFSGGASHEQFVALFNQEALEAKFKEHVQDGQACTIFGEAYGGKLQGMRETYGNKLAFVAFEVCFEEHGWVCVDRAAWFVDVMGLEFVPYERGPTDLQWIDAQRDAPSYIAQRRGIEGDKMREGVVLRPSFEVRLANGDRVLAKHKREEFRETKTPREVDPGHLKVLVGAQAIVDEWVTPMRLQHVLDKMEGAMGIERTGEVIKRMVEDVQVEGEGEIEWSKAVAQALGKRTAQMFKAQVTAVPQKV